MNTGQQPPDGGGDTSPPPPHLSPDTAKPAAATKPDPYAAFRHAAFRRFLPGNFLFNTGRLAMSVAVAVQVYEWTNSAAVVGFLGLASVIPLIAFVLPAGVLADRADRRKIITAAMGVSCVLYVLLALCAHFHTRIPDIGVLRDANALLGSAAEFFTLEADIPKLCFDKPALPVVFVLQFLLACAFVAGNPARAALVPKLVPAPDLTNAFRWNSSAFELAVTLGLLLGGLVAVWSFSAVYAFAAFSAALLGVSILTIRYNDAPEAVAAATGAASTASTASAVPTAPSAPADTTSAWAGVPFIWRHKPVLAAITLDLFAVLFGGVVALFPIYAKEIFGGVTFPFVDDENVHRFVTGLLRAAPALGAMAMAVAGAYLPPFKRPGAALLWTVAGFGAALLVFAVSRNLWLSLAALFAAGMCDNVSVIIRHTLVQVLTPDRLRGRVSAVNHLFIGCSNDISELRGGLMAARFGTVPAAVIGGVCTLLTVAGVACVFKSLRTVPPLHKLKPPA
ncbi:MAG: MFS transporter [Puniceicoccales bacterium]|jgi:MFS family permease|nr:MFS transporter [Puniceicoccales bacterium]